MRFWKEHTSLRVTLIAAFFVVGLIMVIAGWRMTGNIVGLGIMLVGLVLLLAALMVYNKAYQEEKKPGKPGKKR